MVGIERFVVSPLGISYDRRKCWIAAAAGAAVSLASSLIGGAAASKAEEAAKRRQRRMESEEEAWYNRRYNEDYADTSAGQNLLRRARDFRDENVRRAEGARAVAGGTDAAVAQAKEAGNRMMGETVANIAATDQQRKVQADNAHRNARMEFAQMDMDREHRRAANITNAAQNASNAIMQGAAAFDGAGVRSSSPNLTGGSNKGFVAPVTSNAEVSSALGGSSGPAIGGLNEKYTDEYTKLMSQ